MTENDNLRMYYKLRELDLLAEFDPTKREYALDFQKIELWKKYRCSRFWKKYYDSDCVREKFAKLGINFDELDENSELEESDIID